MILTLIDYAEAVCSTQRSVMGIYQRKATDPTKKEAAAALYSLRTIVDGGRAMQFCGLLELGRNGAIWTVSFLNGQPCTTTSNNGQRGAPLNELI